MISGYRVLKNNKGCNVAIEDWRRVDMPSDSLKREYQNICALSNDLTEKIATGSLTYANLTDLRKTVDIGQQLIRDQYALRSSEQLYGKVMEAITDVSEMVETQLDLMTLEFEQECLREDSEEYRRGQNGI